MDYQLAATGRIPIDTHLAGGWQKVIMQCWIGWLAGWLETKPSRERACLRRLLLDSLDCLD